MASSRSPSPGEGSSSPPGTPLTPRSKLKALFADMSGSSDDEASPIRRQSRPSSNKGGQSPTVRLNSPTLTKSPVGDDDESSEEEVVRPRGRLASRMQAQDAVQQQQEESEPEARPEDARERVKRMLAKAAEPQKTGEKDGNSDADMASGEEDDEVVTFRQHRRLKQKSRRSPTPASKTATPQREASPGMFVSPTKEPSPLRSIADGEASDSDADLPPASTKNHRFMALVAKKREEQRAKEAEEERKREARLARQAEEDEQLMDDGESSDITDDEGGRKLTQEAAGSRPAARKASKKALEEMNRETQRMSRSLQLAHEAKTRKKITKASLFERFNFKPAGYTAPAPPAEEKHATSSSRPGTPASDVEMKDADTPPSSPPVVGKEPVGPGGAKEVSALQAVSEAIPAATNTNDDDDGALPTLDDVLAQAYSSQPKPLDKGKGKAVDVEIPPQPQEKPAAHKRQFRVRLPQLEANLVTIASDEEDELVITKPKKSKIDAIFDRVPAKRETESRSMQALRYLAQVDGSPGRKASHGARRGAAKEKESMTVAELQAALQQRAREQAKLERDRRLEMLKAKGIHVQTTEEREQEMNEIEDIVARARREAEEIMQREREAAKAEKRANGEEGAAADPLAWDDSDASDDEEYREEPSEIELSGSEEDEEMTEKRAGLIDEAAESADESEDGEAETVEQDVNAADSDEEMIELPTRKARRNKFAAILSDDDDEEVQPSEAKTPKPKTSFFKSPSANQTTDSPHVPTSVLRSATKTFIPGLPVTNGDPAGLGLTQIFAGTMDDSQASAMMGSPSQPMPTFEPKPTFDSFPDSNFSQTVPDGADMILNSQPTQKETQGEESQGVQIHFTQSQMHGFDSLLREQDATQTSDFLVLTQDGGFQNYSPLKQRFVEPPPSTIETVAVDPSQQPDPSQHESSPLMHKKGKLRRKIQMAAVPESDEEMEPPEAQQPEEEEDEFGFGTTTTTTTAFSVMKDAAAAAEEKKKRKALEAFSKKKSKAKDMVEDQAEESEDEYAGLGGADGEDSDDESTASVKDMIDDETKGSRGDDAKLAGFYADCERASDEKQVEKLFRDITSGMLRRKRAAGADFDGLSDEDDGGEARRRMKRRQFQKMQRALFADERVSKVAENPRNSAFLRTIEDRGSDDEDMDFLFEQPSVGGGGVDSQRSSDGELQQVVAIPDSQPSASTSAAASAPARRAKGRDKRPATLGEIRESLSNLLDDPSESVIPATATDDEEHESSGDERERDRLPATASSGSSNKENSNPRRRQHGAVVDRISLKRAGSSNVSAAGGGGAAGRMAFAAPAAASSSTGGFRVPALLRRATTNNSLASSSSATSAPGGGFGEEGHRAARSKASSSTNGGAAGSGGGVGGGGGAKKKSGINYFARENERRAAMAEKEKRREARKWKGAEGRGAVVGGLFGAGKFE